MTRSLKLALFIVAVIGAGSLVGISAAPGAWYESLQKPWFNPPNWVFGPAWTVLYLLIAIAGWRLWDRGAPGSVKALWLLQLLFNLLWSPVFFALQMPLAALVVAFAMLAAILAFVIRAWPVDRVAAALFLPYAAWVAFACVLNASIVALN